MRHSTSTLAFLLLAACAPGEEPPAAEAPPTPPAAPEPMQGGLTEEEFAALHERSGEAAPPLEGQEVALPGVDGRAYLSLPEGREAPLPGVLVVHEFWGLTDHIRHWADRLAAEGYAALAVDLYGGEAAETRERARELMGAVDAAEAHAVLRAGHTFLVEDPRVRAPRTAVVGWCFGGGWSLQAALAIPELDAAVVYYGQPVVDPDKLRALEAPLLGVFATRDAAIPVEKVREMEAVLAQLGKPHEILFFDAEHAFANPSGGRYAQEPATRAWLAVERFLAEHLRAP